MILIRRSIYRNFKKRNMTGVYLMSQKAIKSSSKLIGRLADKSLNSYVNALIEADMKRVAQNNKQDLSCTKD